MKSTDHTISVEPIKSDDLDLDFQQYWFIIKRRWLPAMSIFGAVVALIFVALSKQKPFYETQGKLLIKPDNTPSLTGLKVEGGVKDLTPLTLQGNPLKTESEIIVSEPILRKTIISLSLKDKQGKLRSEAELKRQIGVKNIGGTDVLEISAKSTDPKEAAAIVNKLMSLYIENNINVNRSQAIAARDFLTKQLPETEAAVRQADANLRRFKEKNQVVSLEQESIAAVEVESELSQKIAEAQGKFAEASARSAALINKLGMSSKEALLVSALSQSPGVQTALTELQKVQNQLATERTRFLDDNPQIVALKNKEAALNNRLQEQIQQTIGTQQSVSDLNWNLGPVEQELIQELVKSEATRLGLSNQVTALTKMQSVYKQRTNVLPKLEQDERELKRRLEAAQATYETLLKKLQEVQVAENQTIGNARIIENSSIPQKPSFGKTPVILVMGGGVVGFLLATIVMVFLEIRDTSIKNVKEARKVFAYKLLAAIPSFTKAEKAVLRSSHTKSTSLIIPVRDTPVSPVSEMYWRLQSNLEFINSEKALKVILVTSSIPKEGKSTVAANLAVTMAELGHRVLIVDADMRYPSQHHLWELTNESGLSNVLADQVELQLAAKQVMLNLYVLPSGVTPLNPLALLKSKEMVSLIEHSSKTYDFVIIDAPPLIPATDALILGKLTDGILLVTRPGVVDSGSAASAKESLEQSGQNVLGLVVNALIEANESNSYLHHTKKFYAKQDNSTPKQSLVEVKTKVYRS
jgi:capsular exopolysaccharide synthesis family protein